MRAHLKTESVPLKMDLVPVFHSCQSSASAEDDRPAIAEFSLQRLNQNAPMHVFDFQGRLLGVISLNGRDMETALRQKFHKQGVYLVRNGTFTAKVRVK